MQANKEKEGYSKSSKRERGSYSKTSKREKEVFKIQQESERELLKNQQEREGGIQNPARRSKRRPEAKASKQAQPGRDIGRPRESCVNVVFSCTEEVEEVVVRLGWSEGVRE